MQRIVVATDGSPGGNRAVDAAAKLARVAGCKLLILTVGGSISGAELRQLAGTEGDLSKTLEEAATQVLGRAEARAHLRAQPIGLGGRAQLGALVDQCRGAGRGTEAKRIDKAVRPWRCVSRRNPVGWS